MHVATLALKTKSTCYLEIGKTIYLCLAQKFLIECIDILLLQLLINVDNVLELLQEPLVNLSELVNSVNIVLRIVHSL